MREMKYISRLMAFSLIICAFIQCYATVETKAETGDRTIHGNLSIITGMQVAFALASPWSAVPQQQQEKSVQDAETASFQTLSESGEAALPGPEAETGNTLALRAKNPGPADLYGKLSFYDPEKLQRYKDYAGKNPKLSAEDVATRVNIGLDKPFYSGVNVIGDPGSLTVLVNKYNKLPDDYAPKLIKLDPSLCVPSKGGQALRPEAKTAFEKMCRDAKKLGLNIQAYGTYRSIPAQTYIWNREIKEGKTSEEVDNYHARGGYSEHNTGLAVDVIGTGYGLSKTKEYEWYKKNAHKYGFILRYGEGRESITGYKYEPWHLRYVGVDVATSVYKSGLTYDEYYTRHLARKNAK